MARVMFLTLIMAAALAVGAGPALADGDTAKGKRVFAKCKACHSLKKGVTKIGPSLHGLFGRKAGTVSSFKRFSSAIKKSGVVWSEDTLEEFLKRPKAFIKGNRMPVAGLRKQSDRDDVIAYLNHATKP